METESMGDSVYTFTYFKELAHESVGAGKSELCRAR